MTDRIYALTVVLDHDYRDDDIEALKDAISQFRGVIRVDQHVADIALHTAEQRANDKWRGRLYDLLAIDRK